MLIGKARWFTGLKFILEFGRASGAEGGAGVGAGWGAGARASNPPNLRISVKAATM